MLKRFLLEDSGMEMVEWAIVGVVFAAGGVVIWNTLNGQIGTALGTIANAANGTAP